MGGRCCKVLNVPSVFNNAINAIDRFVLPIHPCDNVVRGAKPTAIYM